MWWSTGLPFLDLILVFLILVIWVPDSFQEEAIKVRAGGKLSLSEHPIFYWFGMVAISFSGICALYAFCFGYTKGLRALNDIEGSEGGGK